MIRPTFKMRGEESIDDIITNAESVGPKELIIEKLEEYHNEDVERLAIELYDYLSKDKLEESQGLIDQFFIENYQSVNEGEEFKTESSEIEEIENMIEKETPEEKPKDVQVTFKGALE
jgi:hypothetical protein